MATVWRERQTTSALHGHILTNCGVWSRDGKWIVYDVRSDAAGSVFDGTRIERVHVETGQVDVLYESASGACCGVASWSPVDDTVVFILGPENPTPDWHYAPHHRRGVIVHAGRPGAATSMDARELAPPFTPGALRGGTHLHTFSGDGQRIAFTYEDHVLAGQQGSGNADENQRNVGVAARGAGPVRVSQRHPRNHDGEWFSVLVTCTVNRPRSGYVTRSGERRQGIAFQGTVAGPRGESFAEVFAVDLPEDVTAPSESGPLEGTATRRPQPPRGTTQRRLTFTCERRYPGLAGPRHWLHSSPDGSQIAFLMRDDDGVVQLWTVSPLGGEPRQVTENAFDIASAFTWSADGERVAHVMDGSVCVSHVPSGQTVRLTPPAGGEQSPRPEACVFSADGRRIAYVRRVGDWNQVFVCEVAGVQNVRPAGELPFAAPAPAGPGRVHS